MIDKNPSSVELQQAQQYFKKLSFWFFVTTASILCIVIIGGLTRLTGSGLSMVEWHPLMGILPPLSELKWQETFNLYQQSPEYKLINYQISLASFKQLFWLEYIHRLMGRIVGIIILWPLFLSFYYQPLHIYRVKIISLGFLLLSQGLLGWYMVKSGLINDPQVSHYRLVMHLLVAIALYTLCLWYGLKTKNYPCNNANSIAKQPLLLMGIFSLMLTITYGAMVAGLKAGLIYNTFPLMGDGLLPDELLFYSPVGLNFINNPATVQFVHRILAMITLILNLTYIINNKSQYNWLSNGILTVLLMQFTLGIITLLLHVPIWAAILHQIGALLILSLLIMRLYEVMYNKL